MGCRGCCHHINTKITIAAIGISAGLMAGLCFAWEYHNVSTTVMAFTSSVFAALSLYMCIAYKKNWMVTWKPSTYKLIFYGCSVLFVFATIGMVVCLTVAGIMHQTLTREGLTGENLWMTAVWCFMTAKWTGMSAFLARKFSADVMAPLTKTPPIYPEA